MSVLSNSFHMTHFLERLDQLQSVVLYLSEKNEFVKLKEELDVQVRQEFDDFEIQPQQQSLIYRFIIDVDLSALLEKNAPLGNTVLLSALEGTNLFQEVLFGHCRANELLPPDVTSSQIFTKLQVTNFPVILHHLQVERVSDLTKFLDYPGFVRLVGITTGVSGPAKYTQSTKYVCPEEECEGHYGNRYIRTHVPGASETQIIRSDFRCRLCGEVLEEVKASRILSDKVVAELVPVRLCGPAQREVLGEGRLQAVPVFVRDNLVEKVELGRMYEVIGICRSDVQGGTISIALEASNISEMEKVKTSSVDLLPKSVRDAYKGTMSSPWRFPLYLAYRFGEQVLSRGAMLKLKLVLLISLCLDPQKHLMHVLALGKEASQIRALMTYAQQFSARVFPASATTPLCATVRKDCTSWPPYFIQAGSLSLASGGVCPMGDLGAWQKQVRDQLQAVLSSQKMFVDVPAGGQGGVSPQEVLPLRCQVWTFFDPSIMPSRRRKADLLLPAADTGPLAKPLLDSFSFISFLDMADVGVADETIVEAAVHTLVSWSEAGCDVIEEPDVLQAQNIEQLVSMARATEPEMTVEAEMLLHNYYSACRMARSSGLSGSDVPTSAIHALTSLAVGCAKLKLSSVVREEDAVMAVYLYEESLTARFGLSVLQVQPQPHIPESQLPQFLGKELDLLLQHLHTQLLRFCSQVAQSRCVKTEE